MAGQIYREIHQISSEGGQITNNEVWRGYPQDYISRTVPANTFRRFEMYLYGSGWVEVDRPIWAGTLGVTNPQQEEME